MTAASPPFAKGTVVVYKSGGGHMTVERCIPVSDVPNPEDIESEWGVLVRWVQDDGTPHERIIDPIMIERYRSNYERSMEAADAAVRRFQEEREG